MARLLRIDAMLSRTESIDGFHLKLSRTEKELYEEIPEDRRSRNSGGDAAILCWKGWRNQVDDQSLWPRPSENRWRVMRLPKAGGELLRFEVSGPIERPSMG